MKYTFETALVHIKRGTPMRRAIWRKDIDIRLYKKRLQMFIGGKPFGGNCVLTGQEVLAEDWEEAQ